MLGIILGDFMIMKIRKEARVKEKRKAMKVIMIITGILSLILVAGNLREWKIKIFDLGIYRGVQSREKIIEKYVKGIQNENFKMIEKLVPLSYRARGIILKKMKKFRGADFSQSKIFYNEQFLPIKVIIQDIKLRNGREVSDEIYIEKDCQLFPDILNCKKWYLLMGKREGQYSIFPVGLIDNS